jgi:transcriptional regulator with XRE-family HTH domain
MHFNRLADRWFQCETCEKEALADKIQGTAEELRIAFLLYKGVLSAVEETEESARPRNRGNLVRRYRQIRSLSIKQLSRAAGVPARAIRRIEAGKPRGSDEKRLAALAGVVAAPAAHLESNPDFPHAILHNCQAKPRETTEYFSPDELNARIVQLLKTLRDLSAEFEAEWEAHKFCGQIFGTPAGGRSCKNGRRVEINIEDELAELEKLPLPEYGGAINPLELKGLP